MNKFHQKYFRAAKCDLHSDELPVQSDLAYTPSKMLELAEKGIPVSTQTAALPGSFDEGFRTLDFEPDIIHRRGVDLTDVWEAQQEAHARISGAVKKARKNHAAQVQEGVS